MEVKNGPPRLNAYANLNEFWPWLKKCFDVYIMERFYKLSKKAKTEVQEIISSAVGLMGTSLYAKLGRRVNRVVFTALKMGFDQNR